MDLNLFGSGGTGQVRGYSSNPEPITGQAALTFAAGRFGSSPHRAGARVRNFFNSLKAKLFLARKNTYTPRTTVLMPLKAIIGKAFNRFGVSFFNPYLPRTTRTFS